MTRTLLLLAGILGCVLVVACAEKPEAHALRFTECECKRDIWGRELRATICHAESIYGPYTRGCLYERGLPITGLKEWEPSPL